MYFLKKLFFILLFSLTLNSNINSKVLGVDMNDNTIILLNEITNVGESEKWNSSVFFEGGLKVHVLKDGTLTNKGSYILSKKKFGYPSVIRVLNIQSKDKKFIFSPASQPLFKDSISVNLKKLDENGFLYKYSEIVEQDSSLYISPYSPKKIYKIVFVNKYKPSILYEFYSPKKEIKNELEYIRLVVLFSHGNKIK